MYTFRTHQPQVSSNAFWTHERLGNISGIDEQGYCYARRLLQAEEAQKWLMGASQKGVFGPYSLELSDRMWVIYILPVIV